MSRHKRRCRKERRGRPIENSRKNRKTKISQFEARPPPPGLGKNGESGCVYFNFVFNATSGVVCNVTTTHTDTQRAQVHGMFQNDSRCRRVSEVSVLQQNIPCSPLALFFQSDTKTYTFEGRSPCNTRREKARRGTHFVTQALVPMADRVRRGCINVKCDVQTTSKIDIVRYTPARTCIPRTC